MKITIVYGTRPELIKLVPLILFLRQEKGVSLSLISTGQHREMVAEIERLFDISTDHTLDIMKHDQSLTDIMVNVAGKIEPILKKISPDVVLLQGDTSTVATVGTICFYNRIPVGHVEAGLRSFNLDEPFPEEFNRRVISIFARFNFAPTPAAAGNLFNEGISPDKIFITGNTIVDMVQLTKSRLNGSVPGKERKILITAHRRENHGEGIHNICKAVRKLLQLYPDIFVTWPVHPNPNVKEMVIRELGEIRNVRLTEPLGYMDMIRELDEAYLVWSDSGGIQEECPSFRKPVLILRNVTERPEVVESGFGELVGTDTEKIVQSTLLLLNDDRIYHTRSGGSNPFGDGTASRKIYEILKSHF